MGTSPEKFTCGQQDLDSLVPNHFVGNDFLLSDFFPTNKNFTDVVKPARIKMKKNGDFVATVKYNCSLWVHGARVEDEHGVLLYEDESEMDQALNDLDVPKIESLVQKGLITKRYMRQLLDFRRIYVSEQSGVNNLGYRLGEFPDRCYEHVRDRPTPP